MHVSLCTFFMGVWQDYPIIRRGINSGAAARERIYAAPLGSLVLFSFPLVSLSSLPYISGNIRFVGSICGKLQKNSGAASFAGCGKNLAPVFLGASAAGSIHSAAVFN
jgi:hypothetical protein